jgi:hypothetical protein
VTGSGLPYKKASFNAERNFRTADPDSLKKDRAEIRKFEALIQKDDEIITLRTKITHTFAAQLENAS